MDERTPEQILTGIANDLKPEVDRLVSEIGREQVIKNINDGLARLHAQMEARKAGREIIRYDFRNCTPYEARVAIKEGLAKDPTTTRRVYAALANKAWLLLRSDYSDEFRDWHCLINATMAFVRDRDTASVERMTALADLLRASIAQAEIERTYASGMEASQGGDVKQDPSRSDDSPPGCPNTVTPSSQDTSQ